MVYGCGLVSPVLNNGQLWTVVCKVMNIMDCINCG